MDENKDGFVSDFFVKQMMPQMKKIRAEMEDHFKEVDIHGNGLIDFDGFNILFKEYVKHLTDVALKPIKKLLSKYDPNDDGKITIDFVQFVGIILGHRKGMLFNDKQKTENPCSYGVT